MRSLYAMYSLVFQPVFLKVQKFLKGVLQKERIIFLLIANGRASSDSAIVSGINLHLLKKSLIGFR